eukprot:gb/GECG01008604.1/.p1 GENE.gb/GECG01008604.1/~~gb/GECG01008604.1/.p1  ORF type:complete len:187 (+),score=19.48 gb/GECG01008604.1/:1-561(+)
MEQLLENKMFDGYVRRFQHHSKCTNTNMVFSVYLPPQALSGQQKLPVLYFLSGLTCTDQNFITKAGAQKKAAREGVVLVAPDTSPRGAGIKGEDDSYDFGTGASFYVNAIKEPWSKNYQMYDYVTKELPELIESNFPVDPKRTVSGSTANLAHILDARFPISIGCAGHIWSQYGGTWSVSMCFGQS